MIKSDRIICALDLPNLNNIFNLVERIEYDIIFKFGMEFFYNFGVKGILDIKKIKPDMKIFLDLKFHDIPNTVAKAVKPLLNYIRPDILTLHISGGRMMMEEAVKTVKKTAVELKIKKPILMGVTILTSLDQEDLFELGLKNSLEEYVLNYAKLAKKAGLDGVVCSALETKKIKAFFGKDFKVITPGIRVLNSANEDQSRVVTPKDAFNNGSDYIVIGRNLIYAENPNRVIRDIIS